MKSTTWAAAITIAGILSGYASTSESAADSQHRDTWRAVHVLNYPDDDALELLKKDVPVLAKMGINVLILEVDYGFQFQSHPELRQGQKQITKGGGPWTVGRLPETRRSIDPPIP